MILAVVLFAHGIGHVLFPALAVRVADRAGQTGHSWLLTATMGDSPSRAVAGAIVSLIGLVLFWDGIATTHAVFAIAVDVLVLVALVVAHWQSTDAVGS